MWIKLTTPDGTPTWVNLDAYVEMHWVEDGYTVLYTGHIAGIEGEVRANYFTTHVKETPEEILKMDGQVPGEP